MEAIHESQISPYSSVNSKLFRNDSEHLLRDVIIPNVENLWVTYVEGWATRWDHGCVVARCTEGEALHTAREVQRAYSEKQGCA